MPLTTRSLDVSTWDAFVELVERNNGIYGGCWCIVHHPEYERRVSDPRALKQQLVNEGRARAQFILYRVLKRARQHNLGLPPLTATRYINTISP